MSTTIPTDSTAPQASAPSNAHLEQLVADVDRGGRNVGGFTGAVLFWGAVIWSLFQLWVASPLPFALNIGIFNDTEGRALHLGMAVFLGYLAYPARKSSPRDQMPAIDWVLAIIAGFCASYLFIFYKELATRPGIPTTLDIVSASIGLLLLLEVTRRALGAPMAVLGAIFVAYVFLGPWLPDALAHRGASVERLMSHMWLTTEGVYGVALGVSLSYIFIFVLLGSLLDRCGAGNYMMQVSFAMLGHLRGGPAKVAVVSSAVNGIVSASSVANVVTGGIFTIPLMKRAGYGGIRAGAIETASSVNGQIMPPVMGAAAFLMIEYVGIPYTDIIRHALLPASISYIALFYIVHLEALKMGIEPMMSAGKPRTLLQKLAGWGMGIAGTLIVMGLTYWIGIGVQAVAGDAAIWILLAMLAVLYVWLLRVAAAHPDLPTDIDITNPVRPEPWPTVRAGLYYLIPIGILVWCLAVEQLSAGLSAFWAVVAMLIQMITQHPIIAWFRKQPARGVWKQGFSDAITGLQEGARNMVGIAIACGTAGLIVGAITLTGLGLRMTSFVELVSMGNVLIMLFFTAFVCLVLGLGMPTTANYILMATLMAPVVVELGAQNGLVIPLIAVHMFVFYYGIMADITPPVGLATFAAAAISGEDPIKTGIQGVTYAMRTAVLPFMFIFNPMLLLIDVNGWWELFLVVTGATLASLTFAAATLGWMRAKATWMEIGLLFLVTFMLFRPDWFMNQIQPKYVAHSPSELLQISADMPKKGRLVAELEGMNLEGESLTKTVAVALPALPEDAQATGTAAGQQRLMAAGLTVMALGDQAQIASVRFGSQARKGGWEQGWNINKVLVPNPARPSEFWFYIPALLILAFIWIRQGGRLRRKGFAQPAAA
ncbi:TRAP transporter fused permease subunit [Allopusillimonas soli]|uniref:TRAP transporter fused permease subunit n=1 Tax=Allopusillimonas soli TaxID=659016 RepID=A0A853FFC2_9BURK|nr:TRAP transporter fused permease subunit [Allopusillimonas soli]NYT37520.1 TRAP transporter fused permease subunit [Allopusillimonas soli]TEA74506.1 TRAP transporter fused permease subunit [Allopusillimonas soli]